MSDGARGGCSKFTCSLHPIYYYIYNRYWNWNVDNYVRDGKFLLQFHLHSTDHCQIRLSFWDIFWEDLLMTSSPKSHELWAWQISDHRKSHHHQQTFPLFTINHILKSFKKNHDLYVSTNFPVRWKQSRISSTFSKHEIG